MNTSEITDPSTGGEEVASDTLSASELVAGDESATAGAGLPSAESTSESVSEAQAMEDPVAEDSEEAETVEETETASPSSDEAEAKSEAEGMEWYVLKVQSNRENSIRDAILRRIKIAGLEDRVADVVVPTEKVTEMKGGKKRVMERKFYPGYIIIRLILDEDTWFTIRETPGVGDFVGAGGKPVAMSADDVARMLGRKEKAEEEKQPRLQINFEKGDRVKIKEGAFENFEGEVDEVIESKGLVRVMVQVFGRPTPVEVEYWQVEPV